MNPDVGEPETNGAEQQFHRVNTEKRAFIWAKNQKGGTPKVREHEKTLLGSSGKGKLRSQESERTKEGLKNLRWGHNTNLKNL